jgi:hypothetical protein
VILQFGFAAANVNVAAERVDVGACFFGERFGGEEQIVRRTVIGNELLPGTEQAHGDNPFSIVTLGHSIYSSL